MKKIVVLAAATLLGLSSITFSQAEDVVGTPAETTLTTAEAAQDASAEELLDAPMAAADDGSVVEEEAVPVVQDTPQVQKLLELYPVLVQRIKPYGEVCFEGEECSITLTASGGSVDGQPRDGEAVYNAICQTCHATGLLGAPKYGDAGAWGPRIAKGADTLHNHAINGFNAMPAKGGADIPDEEVMNAVDYMMAAAS